jgi:hypothetical protein
MWVNFLAFRAGDPDHSSQREHQSHTHAVGRSTAGAGGVAVLTDRCSRRHAATLAAIAVVLSTVFTMTVVPTASAATAKGSKTKDISESKLRTLDYTDGLLSTGTLANLDPQVITSQSSPGAVTSSFDPSVCMANGGGLDKGIVTGASNTYEATTLNAFDAAFSFTSQKQARQYLDSIAQRSSSCTTFTVAGSTFTISPPKLPKAGDQLATFRASGSVQGTTIKCSSSSSAKASS